MSGADGGTRVGLRQGRVAFEVAAALMGLAALTIDFPRLVSGWPVARTAFIALGLAMLTLTQKRVAGAAPTDTVVMEAGAVFLIPACVLLPPGAAALLSLATDAWFNWAWPETRGRRRFDMALQMAPAYAVAGAAAHACAAAGASVAVCASAAALVYAVVNAGSVFAFGWLYRGDSFRAICGDGVVWGIDGCIIVFGLLTAVAAQATAWVALAAVPVCLLCQYAFLRPHLEAQLLRDVKTSLLNARGMTSAGEVLASAARERHPLAALMIDIDHFKAINDRYGHPVGDEVILEVARRLTDAVRAGSPVGRIGGEEYLVLLPGADLHAATATGERIRAAVAADPVVTERGSVAVTVSVGCAVASCTDGPARSLEMLISDADVELYAAKSAGRDQVSPPHATVRRPALLGAEPPAG